MCEVNCEVSVNNNISKPSSEQTCLKKMNLSTNPLFTHGIEKLCAICHVILGDTDASQSIFSTLEDLESAMNLLQILQSFSNFNFYNGAQRLCTTCYGKTMEVYKFIQMCNKAHDNMQHYLKNIEAIKTIKDEAEVDVKIEEISIEPTRIIIDGQEFLEGMEYEKISKMYEMEMVISGAETKIAKSILQGMDKEETSSNEEITIIVTEEKTDSSDFDNLKVEIIDAQTHDERMDFIKCKDCHLVFSDTKELFDHRKEATHTKEKAFLNEICNSFFETKYNLSPDQRYNAKRAHISEDFRLNQDRHQPLIDYEIDVLCLECQEVFNNDEQLKIHMRRNHKKKFLCNDSGRDNLNTHNRVQTGEKLCKRGFTAQSSLPGDMDSHNRGKPRKCEQCDRRFTTAAHLRRHMDIHNGLKAHKCEQCDRRFTRVSHLRSHMDIHNGLKAHKCEQCDRRFTRVSLLRRHMKSHNEIKAHKCEQCDRRFTRTENLRRHMEIHTGLKAHKCEQCARRFTRAADLRRHVICIHNRVGEKHVF